MSDPIGVFPRLIFNLEIWIIHLLCLSTSDASLSWHVSSLKTTKQYGFFNFGVTRAEFSKNKQTKINLNYLNVSLPHLFCGTPF